MLGTKSKNSTEKKNGFTTSASQTTAETCVIASGTSIEGKFSSDENVRLDGKIKGEVKCGHLLVMGQNGRIEGNVRSKDATIMGTIEGELWVEGLLHLKNSAFIKGTITASKMTVDEGARYMGECKIGEIPGK